MASKRWAPAKGGRLTESATHFVRYNKSIYRCLKIREKIYYIEEDVNAPKENDHREKVMISLILTKAWGKLMSMFSSRATSDVTYINSGKQTNILFQFNFNITKNSGKRK